MAGKIPAALCVGASLLLTAAAAGAADHPWMSDKALVAAAQKEGEVIFLSSFNEDELLARLAFFDEATGIKSSRIRGGDEALISRITIASRAGRQVWDAIEISNVHGFPDDWTLPYELSEAVHLIPEAKDPRHRWYGTETIFHVPGYNTGRVNKANLPTSYADFVNHPELKGHVAVESSDRFWLQGMFMYYGEAKATALIDSIVKAVDPIVFTSHIGLARAVGSGEFWMQLNNFLNLTLNVQKSGDPIDYWVVDPVVITGHQLGINAKAPHANAAKLLANYLISAEGQAQNAKYGRLPTRADVATDPPGLFELIKSHPTVVPVATAAEESGWQKKLDALFKRKQ
jgi:iron(III) transport system substrate-binding protein